MEFQSVNQDPAGSPTFGQSPPPPPNPSPTATPTFTPSPAPTPAPVASPTPAPTAPPSPTSEPAPMAAPVQPAAPEQPQPPAPEAALPAAPTEPAPTTPGIVPPAPAKPKFQFKPKKKTVILAIAFILVVLGVAGGVYYMQQGKLEEKQATLKAVSDGNTTLRLQLTKLQMAEKPALATATAIAPGASASDDLVLTAVRNYCSANVDPVTKKSLILKVTTTGAAKKQVLYSADKTYAYVTAACNKDGSAAGSIGYYLKKVNDGWVFLYRGAAASPEYTKQFNVPATFN